MQGGLFVGRHAELELISDALEAARACRPQIVSIEGPAGIGKTALLGQLLASAQDVVVLRASGDESEIALEYGVVSQLVSSAGPPAAAEASKRTGSGVSVFSVGAEVIELLGSPPDDAPVIVAVDDAHNMDTSSAGALLFALRRLYADRVLVLLASRPEGLHRLGPSWLRLLDDSERVQRARLGGLSCPEVRLLAGALGPRPLTPAAAERLREHTGGHPLHIRALLSELPDDALALEPGRLPAPRSFAATVLAQLANVGTDAQDLVAAAAVAGGRCPLAVAGSLSGVRDPLAALEEAIAAELLMLVPGRIPEEVTFHHPLVRAAVYDDLSVSRRRGLHLACAELTSGSGSLPHRVAASPGADDALAGELVAAGENHVANGDLTGAAEQLLWASRVAGSREVREKALLGAVECLVLAGEVPRAHGLRDAVLACADGPRRSLVLALLTAATGQLAEAREMLRELLDGPELAAEPPLPELVAAFLATFSALLGHGEEAVAWADEAINAARSPATAKLVATQARALGLTMQGRIAEAIASLGPLSAARVHPQPFEAELVAARGQLRAWWGDLRGASDDLSAVMRWSRDGARVRSLPNAYGALAHVEYRRGRWETGLSHAEVAVSLAQDTDRAWDLPFVHAVASYLHAGRGDWRLADEHVAAARHIAELAPVPLTRYYASVAAAHLAWVRGDWEAVLDALAPLGEAAGGNGVPGLGQRVPWLLEAEAMIATGRLDEAANVLGKVAGAMDENPLDVTRVDLWRLRGALEQARRRPAKAQAAFRRGQEAATTAGSPLAQAQLGLTYGRFLHKRGSRRAAIAALREARELFAGMGARPFSERCEIELTACGLRSESPGVNGDDHDHGLTAREQVVAGLVSAGKSNREVAAELYLSTKAIEYHLANIFTKIGIHSRHQLASRLAAPNGAGELGPRTTA